MRVHKKEADTIRKAVSGWLESKVIDEALARTLYNAIEVISFDWKKLAKYSFWISIACIIISIASVISDSYLVALLQRIFDASHMLKCIGLSILSGGIIFAGVSLRKTHPERVYSNESILFFGVVAIAGAVCELGLAIGSGSGHFSLLLLLSYVAYAILGYVLKSNLIWLFSLLSLGGWLGAETGYKSGWGAYYLGMNYPLRFTLFGGVLTIVALLLEKNRKFEPVAHSTLVMGLLYLFISLWSMSIFGNYGDIDAWTAIKQIELFHWSLLFALVSCGAIYHGLRSDNSTTKGFGITFLFINLYTRYFEFFWDFTHKAIFFAILGLSFWFFGRKVEKIWNFGSKSGEIK